EVAFVDAQIRVGGIRTDEKELDIFSALARTHPVFETGAGAPEQVGAATLDGQGHAVLVIRNAVIIPAQAEVERQPAADFPVVLQKQVDLVLLEVAHLPKFSREGIVPALPDLGRAVDEPALLDTSQRSAQKQQEI